MEKVIIFSAPSGAGKTTIVRHLLGKYKQLMFSISATTRNKREHEKDGVDYYFLTHEDLKKANEIRELLRNSMTKEGLNNPPP